MYCWWLFSKWPLSLLNAEGCALQDCTKTNFGRAHKEPCGSAGCGKQDAVGQGHAYGSFQVDQAHQ